MKININLISIILILGSCPISFSQGCSDAGFCTMGALKPNQNHNLLRKINLRSIELTHYFGYTPTFNGNIYSNSSYDYFQSAIVDANIGIGRKHSLQLKIPYNFTYGILANTNGIGDISYGFTRSMIETANLQIGLTVGGKIPTGASNLSYQNKPLPMYYQPGLGTWDALAGIGINYKSFLFSVGIQHPFNTNNNTFVWKPWNSTEDSAKARHYPRTNQFIRGTDVMCRIEYNLRFSNWNMYVGLLNIYRINKDQFKNSAGKSEEIKYSDGLVSSVIVGGAYRFTANSAIKLLVAIRLNDRDALAPIVEKIPNPDGLKRFFVNTITYEYRF